MALKVRCLRHFKRLGINGVENPRDLIVLESLKWEFWELAFSR